MDVSLVEVHAIFVKQGDEVEYFIEDYHVPDKDYEDVVDSNDIALENFIAFSFLPIGTWVGCPWSNGFEMEYEQVGTDFIDFTPLLEYAREHEGPEGEVRFITVWESSQAVFTSLDGYETEHICEFAGVIDETKIKEAIAVHDKNQG